MSWTTNSRPPRPPFFTTPHTQYTLQYNTRSIRAYEPSQKYKEGKFIFEKIKLTLTEDNEGELGWGAAAAGNGNSDYNYNNNNNNTNTNANANASGGRGDQQEDMIFEYQPAQPGGH